MKYKKLGRSGVEVSEVCLGTMTWGNQNTEAEAHEQLDYATEQGINFIDTAELYPVPSQIELQGRTEAYIGSWLAKRGKRDDLVITSKVGGPGAAIATRDLPVRLDRASVLEAIDTTLGRLQTDYVDLYQVHWPQRNTNFFSVRGFEGPLEKDEVTTEETLSALDEVVKAGKARMVGVSNETPWGVTEYLRLAKEKGLPRIVSIQNQYSLTNRTFEVGLSELCMREDVSLLAYSALDFGVLSGKYLHGARPEGARMLMINPDTQNYLRYNSPYAQEAIEGYANIAKKNGLTPAQMALAFAFSRPFMGSVIIGATSMEQLKTNIEAADITLSADILAEIKDVYERNPDPHA